MVERLERKMQERERSRREFLRQVGTAAAGLAAAPLLAGTAATLPAGASERKAQGADRARQILAGFEDIRADYERLKGDIADLIRIRLDLAPELLLPGEEVVLTVEARSAAPPNPTLEVFQDCYQENPTRHVFPLAWKNNRAGQGYAAVWRWRPPRCGSYQLRWACGAGGDVPEFRRNFAVVDRSYLVLILNSTSHREPRPEPDFHALRLPFSYWAEALLFGRRATAEDFARASRWSRQFGDDPGLMVFLGGDYLPGDQTVFYNEPEEVQRTVLDCYRKLWPMLGFPRPLRSLYTYGMGNGPARVARSLGFDLLGALCADQNWGDGPFKINHWGMPARPYFVSREDFRKPGDAGARAVVGVQQCERQTVECRNYNCVYAFEGGIAYALDQYTGITRPRIVDDAILSREMDFFQCFAECAGQTPTPYFASCGIEFNGVWPEMAAINRRFMEYLASRARDTKLAFATATAAADFLRRHARRTPETVLYLPDVYAGVTSNGKPACHPDTMEIENDRFRAIFRRGETLPYAQYDYTTRWEYPDWGNADIPRRKDGYIVPNTDDRFRVTPRIVDTRPFKVAAQVEDGPEATRVTLEVDAGAAQPGLALALWDLPREYSRDEGRFRLRGAQRFIPICAPYTGNLNGIVVADIKPGKNRITLTLTTGRRVPRTQDILLGENGMAKVFERDGSAMAYLFCIGSAPEEIEIRPMEGVTARLYSPDSDEGRPVGEKAVIRIMPGTCWKLAGLTYDRLLRACPTARLPFARWELRRGERYFRVNGTPRFVLGRNPTELTVDAFESDFRAAAAAGESLVRVHLMHGIPPHAAAGQIDEAWAEQWDRIFDRAARHGIAVIPVFSIWTEWNDGGNNETWHAWQGNPYNAARGGPARKPTELLGDTACRRLWLGWLSALIRRWQARPNIVAWEPFSELDLLTGSSPALAVEFVRRAAEAIRAADPKRRPVTVSLSGIQDWPEVFGSPSIDIVQVHPYALDSRYPGNLSDMLLDSVRDRLRRYGKPVLIGEAGLDWRPPAQTLTVAERATIGIRHALWASAVSGAVNGRMLWWEDGYDKYEHADVAGRYRDAAAPVARFVRGVSYAGLLPATVTASGELRGAALAGDRLVLAWFRDARCGPPEWPTGDVAEATVSVEMPGRAPRWSVRFYDTRTGLPMGEQETTEARGQLSVRLPVFRESIAFIARPSGDIR
jgi:hypothetical protein